MEPFISAGPEIDVAKIMAAIDKKIAEKQAAGILRPRDVQEIQEMELQPLPDFLEIPAVYEPHLYPEHPGPQTPPEGDIRETGPVKAVLKVVRRVCFPLIRFMTRPIVIELKNAIANVNKFEITLAQSKDYIILLHNALNNMIAEASKLKIDEELLKTKIKVLEDRVDFLENRQRAVEKKLFPA